MVPQLLQEAEHQLQSVTRWAHQFSLDDIDNYTAMAKNRTYLMRAEEAAKTLVEIYEQIQQAVAAPFKSREGSVLGKTPPKKLVYKGATYILREGDYGEGAVPISDEQPREKGENKKVQEAIKQSKQIYTLPREEARKKVKHPSQIETGIHPESDADYAGGLGGDGGVGPGGDGGSGNGSGE